MHVKSSPECTPTRRSLLGGAATVLGSTAGCLRNARTVVGRDRPQQLSLEIRTMPADSDPNAIRIARDLADNLTAVGIDARINTLTEAELYRQVLLNQNFDLYVGQLPETTTVDPDGLYPLLHSKYGSEPGWQNPFGFADPDIDESLSRQRTTDGTVRWEIVATLQQQIARTQPFISVAFPDELSAVRESRFTGWEYTRPTEPVNLLSLSHVSSEPPTLRLITTDSRLTENRNPIAAEFRRHGSLLDLIYAPLARPIDDELEPWLAREWETLENTDETLTARVVLRDGLTWHDGESVTAEDVAFTYRFLADTSLGRAESPIPTSRFRGRSSLVESVQPVADGSLEITFTTGSFEVGKRALTVPLLPEHVWSEQTGPATIAGIEVNDETTEALVWGNPEPIGCGQLQFLEATMGESVRFDRVDEHPLSAAADLPDSFLGGPEFDELRLDVVLSDVVGVEAVSDNDADATVSNLGPDAVPRIARSPSVTLVSHRSRALYHVGFNTRSAPMSNFRFRMILARLLDKETVVNSVFDGYAVPATSPLLDDWVPESLAWDGHDPIAPFLADENGDLDAEAAKDAFREAGYRYNENGELLTGDNA